MKRKKIRNCYKYKKKKAALKKIDYYKYEFYQKRYFVRIEIEQSNMLRSFFCHKIL